jgi:hypothetical protein
MLLALFISFFIGKYFPLSTVLNIIMLTTFTVLAILVCCTVLICRTGRMNFKKERLSSNSPSIQQYMCHADNRRLLNSSLR